MSGAFSRTKQCKACPWRKATVPERDIPGGYEPARHAALTSCAPRYAFDAAPIMACHEHPVGAEAACVGWLANQLGPGNNIGLRMRALRGEIGALDLDGEQHESLAAMCATAPRVQRRARAEGGGGAKRRGK